jgi:TonB family protein
MMIFRIALLAVLVGAPTWLTSAQDLGSWTDVAPVEESFVARMPTAPFIRDESVKNGPLSVSGKRYTASVDGDNYIVWSFANPTLPGGFHNPSEYLDACADLVWDGLFGPRRAKLTNEKPMRQRMTYRGELSNDGLMGREYQIMLGDLLGVTRIYAQNSKIYILAFLSSKPDTGIPEVGTSSAGVTSVLGPIDRAAASPNAKHFLKSFKVNPSSSAPAASEANSLTSGSHTESGSGGKDLNGDQIFTGRDVTQKVRVLSKPEPSYTESARKYGVTGTVVLRAVFSSDGQITRIAILSRLPHGLTNQALDAARKIKFIPAEKDGQPVSMTVQLEYNFNLY